MARMLDDDGVGQASLAPPLADQQRDAAGVGKDRNQRDLRPWRRELGQVQRQAGAHHDRVGTARARLAHEVRVLRYRAHDVDGDRTTAACELSRRDDLAVERDEIRLVDMRLVGVTRRFEEVRALDRPAVTPPFRREEVGMVTTQVDARYGSHTIVRGDRAREPVRGDAHAHAPLDDGQQCAAAQTQWRQLPCGGDSGKDRGTRRRCLRRGEESHGGNGATAYAPPGAGP
jgi:hypothetical protein